MSANNKQVGGTHYAEGGEVQHWDFIAMNNLSYLVGCATKYITRHRKKNGRQDLEKALHYVEKLAELHAAGAIAPPGFLPEVLVIQPEKFCAANGVTGPEKEVVMLLTFWRGAAELNTAWEIIDGLVKEA